MANAADMSKWQRAVLMRQQVLCRALNDMGSVPIDFLKACKSAAALAKFKSDTLEIEALGSRNTLFKHSDTLFAQGADFGRGPGRKYLEELRLQVYKQFIASGKTGNRRRVRDVDRIRADEREVKALLINTQKTMLAQSSAYVSLLKEVRGVAKDDRIGEFCMRRLMNILNSHDEKFSDLFGPEVFDDIRPDNVRGI